jgi:hypothetical protein
MTTKEQKQRWNEANREKTRAWSKRWNDANPIRRKEISRKAGERYRARHQARGMIKRAKRRGLVCTIVETDIVIPKVCPVLGVELKRATGGKTGGPHSPSLDRIDNTKGYEKGNIVVVSNRVNKLKNDATLEELEKIVRFYRQFTRS